LAASRQATLSVYWAFNFKAILHLQYLEGEKRSRFKMGSLAGYKT
jgi:hypothetical protein